MFPQIPKASTTTLHEIIPLEMKARGDISNESICFRKWALNPVGSASGDERNFCLLLEHYSINSSCTSFVTAVFDTHIKAFSSLNIV